MNCKVAIILPYLKRRGTEKQTFRIATQLKKNGIEPTIFNVQGWGDYQKEFEDFGFNVISVGEPQHVGEKRVNNMRANSLAKLIQKHQCNLILSRANMGHEISVAANKNLKQPLPVVLVTSSAIPSFKGNILKHLIKVLKYRRKFQEASKVVTVSEQGMKNLKTYLPFWKSKIISIPNGIDLDTVEIRSKENLLSAFNREQINITFVGSLDIQRKGIDVLLQSFKKVISQNLSHKLKLHIIGSGAGELEVKNIVEKLGIHNEVICHGEMNNPYPALKNSDIFVLPSRKEGMPNALLEAMGLGVCSIATDCETGPSEVIESYKNGILIPTEDSSVMAEKITELINDVDLRDILGANGKNTIQEKYTIEKMGDSYTNLFKELISNRGHE